MISKPLAILDNKHLVGAYVVFVEWLKVRMTFPWTSLLIYEGRGRKGQTFVLSHVAEIPRYTTFWIEVGRPAGRLRQSSPTLVKIITPFQHTYPYAYVCQHNHVQTHTHTLSLTREEATWVRSKEMIPSYIQQRPTPAGSRRPRVSLLRILGS